jgi:hypothetical protein
MKNRFKIWLRQWFIRKMIKLVDHTEELLQAWQVSLRNDLCDPPERQHPSSTVHSSEDMLHQRTDERRPQSETFGEWEMRRAGVAPISKKAARRQRGRMTAASFDLRFAR